MTKNFESLGITPKICELLGSLTLAAYPIE